MLSLGLLCIFFFLFLQFSKRIENVIGSVGMLVLQHLVWAPCWGCVFVSLQLRGHMPSCATCVAGARHVFLLFRALNICLLYCKQMQSSNNTKHNGDLTVLQIVGTCLALCLSSDLKSLSVVTEVSTSGAPEVSYFQVSTGT